MDEFQIVKSRKTNKKKTVVANVERILKTVYDIRWELKSTSIFTELNECLLPYLEASCGSGRHVDMVCYGLGSFVEAHIARYQLALMTALRDKFQSKVPFRNCEVYDPIFITEERTLLQELGFTVLMTNEEGKRMCRPDAMTVFYLPHCGKALYNNLLWANWGPGLQHIIVIGNSFTAMTERTPFRILQSTAKYVANIQPYTKEQPLTIPDQFSDVFNDTSVHSFPTNLLDTVRDALWDDNAEPVYTEQDAEIIFKAQ